MIQPMNLHRNPCRSTTRQRRPASHLGARRPGRKAAPEARGDYATSQVRAGIDAGRVRGVRNAGDDLSDAIRRLQLDIMWIIGTTGAAWSVGELTEVRHHPPCALLRMVSEATPCRPVEKGATSCADRSRTLSCSSTILWWTSTSGSSASYRRTWPELSGGSGSPLRCEAPGRKHQFIVRNPSRGLAAAISYRRPAKGVGFGSTQ